MTQIDKDYENCKERQKDVKDLIELLNKGDVNV